MDVTVVAGVDKVIWCVEFIFKSAGIAYSLSDCHGTGLVCLKEFGFVVCMKHHAGPFPVTTNSAVDVSLYYI